MKYIPRPTRLPDTSYACTMIVNPTSMTEARLRNIIDLPYDVIGGGNHSAEIEGCKYSFV